MHRTHSHQRSYFRRPAAGDPHFLIVIFIATVMAALVALLPPPILPAFSLCALIAAACVALAAGVRPHTSPSAHTWNLAGAFALVGCATAILGEVEPGVEYTRLTTPRSRADD